MSGTVAPGDTLLGKYRVERVLGQGGMGNVVAARHIELGELFAVKLMVGEMGEETLLSGQRVIPRRLLEADFRFDYPELAGALQHEIRK